MKVTEAFLGLDENIKKCQTNMPIGECESIYFLQTVKNQRHCVPYKSRNFNHGNGVFVKLIQLSISNAFNWSQTVFKFEHKACLQHAKHIKYVVKHKSAKLLWHML